MSQIKYLFDADALMTAKRDYYSPRFCVAFWDWIVTGNQNSVLFTTDRVSDECKKGDEEDYLRKFVELHNDYFVKKTKADHSCIIKYSEIQVWANAIWVNGKDKNKVKKALEVFANEKTADPWLVAYASVYGYSIISNEKSSPMSQTSVKLPDVANAFGVKVVRLNEVLNIHSAQNFHFKTL